MLQCLIYMCTLCLLLTRSGCGGGKGEDGCLQESTYVNTSHAGVKGGIHRLTVTTTTAHVSCFLQDEKALYNRHIDTENFII